jgi:hypothetical protein
MAAPSQPHDASVDSMEVDGGGQVGTESAEKFAPAAPKAVGSASQPIQVDAGEANPESGESQYDVIFDQLAQLVHGKGASELSVDQLRKVDDVVNLVVQLKNLGPSPANRRRGDNEAITRGDLKRVVQEVVSETIAKTQGRSYSAVLRSGAVTPVAQAPKVVPPRHARQIVVKPGDTPENLARRSHQEIV